MEITLNHYLAVAAVLFAIGLMGVIMRRNILIIYMSIEMMLQAANLTLSLSAVLTISSTARSSSSSSSRSPPRRSRSGWR